MSHHPTKRLTAPDGSRADIDVLLVPLIQALWDAGYETIGCCQDIGEGAGTASERFSARWAGYALVEMFVADVCSLLDQVKNSPKIKGHMHWADPGAWSISIQVMPHGWDGDDATPAPFAQLYVPCDQINDLVAAIKEVG